METITTLLIDGANCPWSIVLGQHRDLVTGIDMLTPVINSEQKTQLNIW